MNKKNNSTSTFKATDLRKNLTLPASDAIIALWALSESALGGVLHAFKIPLTGLIIGSSAIIFITLLAHYGKQRGTILKATIIVLLVKGLISPHTPLAAYFAVFMQGFLGELLFYNKRFFFVSAILLGILVGLLSAFQKVFITTIIFGQDIWKAIDQFVGFIMKQLFFQSDSLDYQYSFLLISIYAILHLAAGITAGIIGTRLPKSITSKAQNNSYKFSVVDEEILINHSTKKKRKTWWQKPTGILIFTLLVGVMLISYLQPESAELTTSKIAVMLLRSFIIILVWFFFAGPLLLKVVKKIMEKQKNRYTDEVDKIINALPILKIIVRSIWKSSADKNIFKRITFFVSALFVYILSNEEKTNL